MHLRNLQSSWDRFAMQDPMWAVLTKPENKGNKWPVEDFFASGRADIEQLVTYLKALSLNIPSDTALDFGCGVGRLTQGLCQVFKKVYGVDISPSMIESARHYNQHGERCEYILNNHPDLRVIQDESIGFVYTVITLQHIPSHLQRRYIQDFFRVLKPGGVTVFRTLAATTNWRMLPPRLLDLYRILSHRGKPFMGAYGVSISRVIQLIRCAGCELIELKCQPTTDSRFGWVATQYCVAKPQSSDRMRRAASEL